MDRVHGVRRSGIGKIDAFRMIAQLFARGNFLRGRIVRGREEERNRREERRRIRDRRGERIRRSGVTKIITIIIVRIIVIIITIIIVVIVIIIVVFFFAAVISARWNRSDCFQFAAEADSSCTCFSAFFDTGCRGERSGSRRRGNGNDGSRSLGLLDFFLRRRLFFGTHLFHS